MTNATLFDLLSINDIVTINFHSDEIDYIQNHHPELLHQGEIIAIKMDFYKVKFGNEITEVEGNKLLKVNQ